MTTTVEKGNSFRDTVASMLEAAGFRSESEIRIDFKKTDVVWLRQDIDGPRRYLVEAKDHDGTLQLPHCRDFKVDYGALLDSKHADSAWLVSHGPISPDGRGLIATDTRLKSMTFAEFQRRLFGIDGYLQEVITKYENDGIEKFYIHPHTDNGDDLEAVIRRWLEEVDALPIAIVAGYGRGKSTFARHLTSALAREALKDAANRAPVLVPLGEIVDEQSLEGLLGKFFTSRAIVQGYNFGLFERLNSAGRFLVIFDGFDEMKHGMTLEIFESNIRELLRLDRGAAKVIVLGRDTAFQDEVEFRAVIHGRQRTSGHQDVPATGRRPFHPITVREFTLPEAQAFVRNYFPIAAREARRGDPTMTDAWLSTRGQELLNDSFNELLMRPVHAQMLCQIATDPDVSLGDLSEYRLFDRFVHFLLHREVSKHGRSPKFSLRARRSFNSSLSLWLWEQGGASTVSLAAIPAALCTAAATGVDHNLDNNALRRELTAGCLVEKGPDTTYFGHRSLQEFLVAEELVNSDLTRRQWRKPADIGSVLRLINPEIAAFIVEAVRASPIERRRAISDWFDRLIGLRMAMPRASVELFARLMYLPDVDPPMVNADPWFVWLHFFGSKSAVDFKVSTERELENLSRLLEEAIGESAETAAATLLLCCHVVHASSDEMRPRLITTIVAAWLGIEDLAKAVGKVAGRKKGEIHYIKKQEEFRLWCFLRTARIVKPATTQHIEVDLAALAAETAKVAGIGISDVARVGEDKDPPALVCEIQALYRTWNVRDSALERVRPFFNDESLRARIRPLEVEVRSSRPFNPTAGKELPRS